MQENKKDLIYASTIIALIATLGVIWFFLIQTITPTTNQTGSTTAPQSTTSASYSAAKTITEDATIESGEFTSSSADENAISVSGNIATNST